MGYLFLLSRSQREVRNLPSSFILRRASWFLSGALAGHLNAVQCSPGVRRFFEQQLFKLLAVRLPHLRRCPEVRQRFMCVVAQNLVSSYEESGKKDDRYFSITHIQKTSFNSRVHFLGTRPVVLPEPCSASSVSL